MIVLLIQYLNQEKVASGSRENDINSRIKENRLDLEFIFNSIC